MENTLSPVEPIATLDKPLIVIEPTKSLVSLNWADLWSYRELFFFLTWRDIKVRYKQTLLGAAWAVLQPFCTMVIFTLIFGRLAKMPSDGIPYAIFAYAGLLPWTFFSNAITNSGNSLVGSSNLITKVYFPRIIIPSAAVGAGLVDFGIAFLLLLCLLAWFHIGVSLSMLMLPVLVVLTTVLAVAVGMLLSSLNVKYRDIRYATPFIIQLWMFASPVIYPVTIVPPDKQWLLALNPMTGIIDGFRSAIFGRAFNWQALGTSAVITLVLLAYSVYSFRRMEKNFADII